MSSLEWQTGGAWKLSLKCLQVTYSTSPTPHSARTTKLYDRTKDEIALRQKPQTIPPITNVNDCHVSNCFATGANSPVSIDIPYRFCNS